MATFITPEWTTHRSWTSSVKCSAVFQFSVAAMAWFGLQDVGQLAMLPLAVEFTWEELKEGLWPAIVVEIAAASVATAGAFFVARVLFRDQVIHDITVRREDERAKNANVRRALCLEVEHNLEMLKAFWPRFAGQTDDGAAGYALRDSVVPIWSTGIQRTLAETIAVALQPHEIPAIFHLYSTLDEIQGTQSLLRKVWHDDADRIEAGETAIFDTSAREIFPRLRDRVNRALSAGNPIAAECSDH